MFSSTVTFGATFCVSDEAELQAALTTAASNGEDDTVKIVQGTYSGNFTYASIGANSLTLQGGYTDGCASREIDPANTVLDGGGSDMVLALVSQEAANFSVEGLTLRNGNASTVDGGGGLYARTEEGHVTLTNNIFTENTGSGIYADCSSTLTGNTFSGNSCSGAYIGEHSTLTNNTFSENSCSGAYIGEHSTLTNNTFSENRCRGAYIGEHSTLTNNTFSGNTSEYQGGGAYVGANSTLTNNTFSENTANQGGGAYLLSFSTLTNNTFSGNTASKNTVSGHGGQGGGAYILNSGTLTNNTFSGNTASNGGGFWGVGTLTNNTFSGNTAYGTGGGAYVGANSTLTNNTFNGNTANQGGGAYLRSNGILTGNTFTENTADWYGGGAFFETGPYHYGTLTNNLFITNTSGKSGGGIYASGAGSVTLTNNTFTENTAENEGGGVWVKFTDHNGGGSFYNNIIWSNSASEASSLYMDNTGDDPFFPVPVQLYNNDFDQSASGIYIAIPFAIDPSNLDNLDPLFVGGGNYHLTASSPCINTGNNDAPDLPGTDKDDNPRIVDGTVDMGAYEYNPSAPTADAGPDQTVDAGAPVTLDGSSSFDPESEPLTYLWTQIGGTIVALSDSAAVQPTFTAPMISLDGGLIFQLAVINTSDLMNTDWVTVNVEWDGLIYIAPDGQCGGNTPCYSKIQDGIDLQYDTATIKVEHGTYDEDIVVNQSKEFTLQCGWDSTFTTVSGRSTVSTLKLSNGTTRLNKGCLGIVGAGD